MKKRPLVLVFTAILMVLARSSAAAGQEAAGAGWERGGFLGDGDISCIAGPHDRGGTVYAGGKNGIYVKDPGPGRWRRAEGGSCTKDIQSMAFSGDHMFYVASDGIYSAREKEAHKLVHEQKGFKGVCALADGETEQPILLAWTATELYTVNGGSCEIIGSCPTWKSIDDAACRDGRIFVVSGGSVFIKKELRGEWSKIFLYPCPAEEEEPDGLGESGDDSAGEEPNEDVFVATSSIYPEGPNGVTVSTPQGIYRITVDGEKLLFGTEGLPEKRVERVVDTESGLFAATDRAVFRLHEQDGAWFPVFERAGAGKINFMYSDLGEDDRRRLWVACGEEVYMSYLDGAGDIIFAMKDTDNEVFVRPEPSIIEVQRMAVEYAEVSPEKIRSWRSAARWKALMPKLSVGFGEARKDNMEIYTSATTSYYYTAPQRIDEDWDVGLSWDLSDIIWTSAQTSIDVRSKLMVQLRNDILQEVTRLYFERKRIINDIGTTYTGKGKGKGDSKGHGAWSMEEKAIRIEELTAHIDALTGGRFSRAMGEEERKD